MTEKYDNIFIIGRSREGKSVLDTMLKLQGVPFVSGPVHTDGPKEYAEAKNAAHDIEACLPNLHDTVQEATDKSLTDDELRTLLVSLPEEIREEIAEWGLADTEVREQNLRFPSTEPNLNMLLAIGLLAMGINCMATVTEGN